MTLPEFSQAFALLAVQLRATDADEATIRGYYEALKELDLELVEMAARQFARRTDADGQSWFPRTGEWRAMVSKIDAERQELQKAILRDRQRAGLPPLCVDCDDTGWHMHGNHAHRCRCLKTRRLEVLGIRPMPALPDKTPDDPATMAKVNAMVTTAVKSWPT